MVGFASSESLHHRNPGHNLQPMARFSPPPPVRAITKSTDARGRQGRRRLTQSNATEISRGGPLTVNILLSFSDRVMPGARIYIMDEDGSQIRFERHRSLFRRIPPPNAFDCNFRNGSKLGLCAIPNALPFTSSGPDGKGLRTLVEGILHGYGCYHGVCWRWVSDCILLMFKTPIGGMTRTVPFSVNPETGNHHQITDEWGGVCSLFGSCPIFFPQ